MCDPVNRRARCGRREAGRSGSRRTGRPRRSSSGSRRQTDGCRSRPHHGFRRIGGVEGLIRGHDLDDGAEPVAAATDLALEEGVLAKWAPLSRAWSAGVETRRRDRAESRGGARSEPGSSLRRTGSRTGPSRGTVRPRRRSRRRGRRERAGSWRSPPGRSMMASGPGSASPWRRTRSVLVVGPPRARPEFRCLVFAPLPSTASVPSLEVS